VTSKGEGVMTVFKEITNEDIYSQLQELTCLAKATHEQACKTNGRVTNLEKRSLGMWIARHPFKFTSFVLITISFLVSDIRHPMIDLIKTAFL
jgi:hypothetical protein